MAHFRPWQPCAVCNDSGRVRRRAVYAVSSTKCQASAEWLVQIWVSNRHTRQSNRKYISKGPQQISFCLRRVTLKNKKSTVWIFGKNVKTYDKTGHVNVLKSARAATGRHELLGSVCRRVTDPTQRLVVHCSHRRQTDPRRQMRQWPRSSYRNSIIQKLASLQG